jgi:hypothetical protein
MNSFFKVPTDGRFTQYKLNPSQLLVACWMSNLIQLNFSQLSYSYIKVGLNTQCGIELDVRTIRSIVTSLVNKGIFTRSKKSNFYIYNIVDQNVPKNIQNDPLQNDPLQNDPLQNDPLNKDQNVPLGIQKDPYQVDQNVPKKIQNNPSINKNNKEIEETKEEERTPVTSVIPVSAIKFDFDYQSLQDIPNLSDRAAKVYEEAYKVFPREIIRAQEVSVCVEEMSLCYELNAREFERSKPNFKDTAKERAGLIVQALLADKSKFAPIEILWGINRYKTTNTAEPTPATVKRECIKSRVENKGYNNDLQYLIRLRRDEQRICSKNANDFLCRFADRYASELEGLLNAYYAESKDYDVKFNELVLKMAEMPPIQESTPNYWNIYQNRSRELPINLDVRMIA